MRRSLTQLDGPLGAASLTRLPILHREPATTEQQQFARDLQRLFEGSDGVVTFGMLSGPAAMSIVDDALRGDARSKTIMAAAENLLERLETVEAGAARVVAKYPPIRAPEPPA